MMTIFCSKCGAQNAADSRFCTKCGLPLAAAQPGPVFQAPAPELALRRKNRTAFIISVTALVTVLAIGGIGIGVYAALGGFEPPVDDTMAVIWPSDSPLATPPITIAPASDPPTTETPSAAPAPTAQPTAEADFSALLPAGEPGSTNTVNGIEVAIYDDGTVSLNGGRGIITPDGSVYINGAVSEPLDMIEIPDGGTVSYVNDCAVAVVDGKLYVAANGGLICVNEEGDASAYETPE